MGYPDDAADDPLSRGHAHGTPAALRHPRREATRPKGAYPYKIEKYTLCSRDAACLFPVHLPTSAFLPLRDGMGRRNRGTLVVAPHAPGAGPHFWRELRPLFVSDAALCLLLTLLSDGGKRTAGRRGRGRKGALRSTYHNLSLLPLLTNRSFPVDNGHRSAAGMRKNLEARCGPDPNPRTATQHTVCARPPTQLFSTHHDRRKNCFPFAPSPPPLQNAKVFVEASLRDPACANKLLAEGEGLFYMRRPPSSPPPRSAEHARRASPHPAAGIIIPAPSSASASTTPTSGADARGAKDGTTGRPRGLSSSSRTTPSEAISATSAGATATTTTTTTRDLLSYDEAIREFGPGNLDAAANVVAFYDGDLSMLHRTAKL